ncbi:unnamed protein product [Lampetra planeri]
MLPSAARDSSSPRRGATATPPAGVPGLPAVAQQPRDRCHLSFPGLPHYDNVRPLSYPDANAILVCFDIARPETLDSVLKKWQGEIQEYCPNTKVFLVGCKSDLRTDLSILSEFSEQQQNPISYEQGASVARQIGAARYLECSARTLESSVREVFRAAAMALSTPGSAAGGRLSGGLKRSRSKRLLQRISRLGGRPELNSDPAAADKAKSCTIM